MSTQHQYSVPIALLTALFFSLSACATPTPAANPTVQATAVPTAIPTAQAIALPTASPTEQAAPTEAPLLIPQGPGLPQPQSQKDVTPPALHIPSPEPQSTSSVLKLPDNPMSRLPQAAPAEQVALFDIVGIWASQEETQYGTVYSQVILERTGTYSMQSWWRDLLAYEVGTYYVGDGFIHFMLDNYEPKIYKGRWMSRPMSWTAWYTIIDANTMTWEDRILGSQWTVYRQ